LTHFDIPDLSPETYALELVDSRGGKTTLSLSDIQALPQKTERVTLECAGNGRALHDSRSVSMPWRQEAVSTGEWSGTPLHGILDLLEFENDDLEIVFYGADRGFDKGIEHYFGRSLTLADAKQLDVLVVDKMNGQPLMPQHGAPLRLIVPGWFGMASVKWLTRIEVWKRPFDGHQQVGTYRYRQSEDDSGIAIQNLRVKSSMIPPGVPDWASRARLVDAGPVTLSGRAWSGGGVAITGVDVNVNGDWQAAALQAHTDRYAWTGWRFDWDAQPGPHVLSCRATDADGNTQPLSPPWDQSGFGNNVVQTLSVMVR
jgi:DMSO/TMAO reductase YedYZ molybdopterin-dependent catalytic subunit